MISGRGTLLLIALALLTASCSQGPPTTDEGGWPLAFHRTGGIAGFDKRLAIEGDGTAVWQDGDERMEFQVGEETLVALQTLLEAADFRELPDATPVPPGGADFFFYSITYAGHTIRFHDQAVPAGIEPLLNLINEILASRVET